METAEPWTPDPESLDRAVADAEQTCVGCGHPDYLHTGREGDPGDCLHRVLGRGRFDCACDKFEVADA